MSFGVKHPVFVHERAPDPEPTKKQAWEVCTLYAYMGGFGQPYVWTTKECLQLPVIITGLCEVCSAF